MYMSADNGGGGVGKKCFTSAATIDCCSSYHFCSNKLLSSENERRLLKISSLYIKLVDGFWRTERERERERETICVRVCVRVCVHLNSPARVTKLVNLRIMKSYKKELFCIQYFLITLKTKLFWKVSRDQTKDLLKSSSHTQNQLLKPFNSVWSYKICTKRNLVLVD